jgi:hypothetical protein
MQCRAWIQKVWALDAKGNATKSVSRSPKRCKVGSRPSWLQLWWSYRVTFISVERTGIGHADTRRCADTETLVIVVSVDGFETVIM